MKLSRSLSIYAATFVAGLATVATAQTAPKPGGAYWGEPSVDGGKCCTTLGEVRDNIDRIDDALIKLMSEREKYVAEAGRFKKDPAAVSDPKRVEAIIVKVRAQATKDGLAPDVADRAFRAMIAGFEDYERAEWLKRHPAK
ncbi:MAG: chorismate mutase [Hyphomicrobiales bacterium]|nr:chorismate mutase [Hyphomicrobiales bacterium]MDE2018354.1 chorismate mutase [Hyphomicrobiales bacterium]